jgi:hypothetical protein
MPTPWTPEERALTHAQLVEALSKANERANRAERERDEMQTTSCGHGQKIVLMHDGARWCPACVLAARPKVGDSR